MEQKTPALPKGFIRLGGTPQQVASKLGPLADLEGTWKGSSGWNLIAVPSQTAGKPSFTLLIQQYSETITFTPITAPVPNRGGTTQQFITGLLYQLTINDMKYPNGILHVENGMWLNMSDIEVQPDGPVTESAVPAFTIARQSSIPHGDVVIALGGYTESTGIPVFPALNAVPTDIGVQGLGYLENYPHDKLPGLDSSNMNAQLAAAITGQTIGKVTEIIVDTENTGGSIANIPFVQGHVSPSRFQSTFWIEEVLTDNLNFLQLQYSQQTNLNFLSKNTQPPSGVIMWPHANVNTLRKI
ncbi:MAG TPA: heme-binding protein [Mucilaginibacter sp.]|nr:heme-binding protein [Mucilaginibacter sp.]